MEDLIIRLSLFIGQFLVPDKDDPLHQADVDILHGAVNIGLRQFQEIRQLRNIDPVGPKILIPLHDLGDRKADQFGFHQCQVRLLAPQQFICLHDAEVLAVSDGNAVFFCQIIFRRQSGIFLNQRIIHLLVGFCVHSRNLFLFHSVLLHTGFRKFNYHHILSSKRCQPHFSCFLIFRCTSEQPPMSLSLWISFFITRFVSPLDNLRDFDLPCHTSSGMIYEGNVTKPLIYEVLISKAAFLRYLFLIFLY